MQRQQRLKDDKGRFISANPPRMTIDKDGTITGGPKPKAKAKAKAKATISKRKPTTAETREANRELAIRWREARAKKKMAEHKEGEEGDIVKQAPQGFKPERRTRKPREQEEDADDLGADFGTSASSRAKPKRKVTHPNPPAKDDSKKDKGGKKKGGSVKNTIEEIIEASNLPPGQQALLPPNA